MKKIDRLRKTMKNNKYLWTRHKMNLQKLKMLLKTWKMKIKLYPKSTLKSKTLIKKSKDLSRLMLLFKAKIKIIARTMKIKLTHLIKKYSKSKKIWLKKKSKTRYSRKKKKDLLPTSTKNSKSLRDRPHSKNKKSLTLKAFMKKKSLTWTWKLINSKKLLMKKIKI